MFLGSLLKFINITIIYSQQGLRGAQKNKQSSPSQPLGWKIYLGGNKIGSFYYLTKEKEVQGLGRGTVE